MKNTKELFIRLYIGTLYSNFIVPLRKCNYIQLLYGGFQKRLCFFFKYKRWLALPKHINEVGQKLYESWLDFEIDGLDQNLTETWLRLNEATTKTLSENGSIRAKWVGQNLVRIWSAFQLLQLFPNASLKMSLDGIKCHQNFIDLSSAIYHQITTEIPPEMTDEPKYPQLSSILACRRKIGSIRVKSDQKIGVNRCKSVQILTTIAKNAGSFQADCGQKIESNRVKCGQKTRATCDQMLPNATPNNLSTYQRLILLNSSFMLCC